MRSFETGTVTISAVGRIILFGITKQTLSFLGACILAVMSEREMYSTGLTGGVEVGYTL